MSITKLSSDLYLINSSQMDNNSYVLFKDKNCIIIDPSFSAREIQEVVGKNKVEAIVLTHAHFDHCYEAKILVDKYDCPVYIHKKDKDTYENYHYANLVNLTLPKFTEHVKYYNSQELTIGDFNFKIVNTPGHTKGSVCIWYNNYVFVGDTLFFNSYGRTDLVNSSQTDMIKSLTYLWNNLKDNDLILPGHSQYGSFKQVKQYNNIVDQMINDK